MTEHVTVAKDTIRKEIASLDEAISRLDCGFDTAVEYLVRCQGKIIVSGLGKSGIVANKIAATLASTGSPSIYLHPVEALHGDFGIVQSADVAILLSKSGETQEVVQLLQQLRRASVKVVAIVGDIRSTIAKYADAVLDSGVRREACPLDLAPTSSTLVAMALGDALAACLIRAKGFTRDDFARLHPSGALGHRLLLRVEDVMHGDDELPLVAPDAPLSAVLLTLCSKPLGAALIVAEGMRLEGIFTDGDLKRALQNGPHCLAQPIRELMTTSPATVFADQLATEALALMENRPSQIAILPVLTRDNKVVGLVRVHDVISLGIR